ncbi:xylan glycosyltransferase MUCI21 [Spinacia oleracea]|uniref:Xylan glycosyltransferase MUCI21 n=1 Tax=Spinacia oleracea TaxID=3562 RepID=A0A9R0I123_SPIOL|nr:xylan glycosyltransferase MUCI21 [Spinacia oleracea]
MVHHQRYYQMKKGGEGLLVKNFIVDEESQIGITTTINGNYFKRAIRPKLLSFLFLSLLSCSLIWTPQLFGFPSTFSLLYSLGAEDEHMGSDVGSKLPLCSSVANGTICCDRSGIRTDVCYMKGDIRTHSASSSIFLYTQNGPRDFSHMLEDEDEIVKELEFQREKIRPYTRKWETSVMSTIDELSLVSKHVNSLSQRKCDVVHDVPAVFFSTGGYTGNVYHEFNDGIIPLYITSQQFNKKVVFVILEYHNWWITKYGDILSHLTDYPPIDYSGDNRTHCFPEAIVGLNIHDELTIDQSLMKQNKSIRDFRNILDRAYWPRINGLIQDEEREKQLLQSPSSTSLSELDYQPKKPKLVILSRSGSRVILNEDSLVKVAEKIGFEVEVLRPEKTSELAKIYRVLNSSDVMIGVHGAAMTHFLFVKPGGVFIQVVPLGTDWAAQTYYGDPAMKLGLEYIGYKILPRESSLYDDYDRNDPVLSDPDSVNAKGWEFTKKIYLDKQNVKLDLKRFKKRLLHAYHHLALSQF